MNIAEILKDAPKGTKLWSPLCGEVYLDEINFELLLYPIRVSTSQDDLFAFTEEGYFMCRYPDAECMLFPSKENRDWSTFKVENIEKYDLPKGTPVMVTNCRTNCEDFYLRYYAGNKACYPYGAKQGWPAEWDIIIPFDKFNPNNIEESLKYKL